MSHQCMEVFRRFTSVLLVFQGKIGLIVKVQFYCPTSAYSDWGSSWLGTEKARSNSVFYNDIMD